MSINISVSFLTVSGGSLPKASLSSSSFVKSQYVFDEKSYVPLFGSWHLSRGVGARGIATVHKQEQNQLLVFGVGICRIVQSVLPFSILHVDVALLLDQEVGDLSVVHLYCMNEAGLALVVYYIDVDVGLRARIVDLLQPANVSRLAAIEELFVDESRRHPDFI